jgi:hypothetical protein
MEIFRRFAEADSGRVGGRGMTIGVTMGDIWQLLIYMVWYTICIIHILGWRDV